jgi:hypothetical protein
MVRRGVGGGGACPSACCFAFAFCSEICVDTQDTQVDVEMSNFTLMLKYTEA